MSMDKCLTRTKVLNEDFALEHHHLHAIKTPPYEEELELHSSLESQPRSLLGYGMTESWVPSFRCGQHPARAPQLLSGII